MKYLICLLFVCSGLVSLALPEVTEMIKYIGKSKYQPDFAPIYEELVKADYYDGFNMYNDNPDVLAYDGAHFIFDESKRLLAIHFVREMPFCFKEGMSQSRVDKRIKRLTNKKTNAIKEGYYVSYALHVGELDILKVSINSSLTSERSKGEHIIDGLKFYNPKELLEYASHKKGTCFAYLDKVNGTCTSGNCEDGIGSMQWNGFQIFGETTFTGNFKNGEPHTGKVNLTTLSMGTLVLEKVNISGGFINGTTKIVNNGKALGTFSFYKGNLMSAENYDFGTFWYSGDITNNFRLVFSKTDTTILKYKNGYNARVIIDWRDDLIGLIDYSNGFTYQGGFSYVGKRSGWGTITDHVLNGTWRTYFTEDVPDMDYYWTYADGTFRKGNFDVIDGFNGQVTTSYTNLYSRYVVTGEFKNNKATGIHSLLEETTNNTVGTGQYLRGMYVSGNDVYKGTKNSLTQAIAEEARMQAEFVKEAKNVQQRYESHGYTVYFGYGKHYKKDAEDVRLYFNQQNLTINFAVYDPYSNADEYVVEPEVSRYGTTFKYPNIILQRTGPNSAIYYSAQSILTKDYFDLACTVRAVGAKKSRYNAAVYHLSN